MAGQLAHGLPLVLTFSTWNREIFGVLTRPSWRIAGLLPHELGSGTIHRTHACMYGASLGHRPPHDLLQEGYIMPVTEPRLVPPMMVPLQGTCG